MHASVYLRVYVLHEGMHTYTRTHAETNEHHLYVSIQLSTGLAQYSPPCTYVPIQISATLASLGKIAEGTGKGRGAVDKDLMV